jgi:hypothetical protein
MSNLEIILNVLILLFPFLDYFNNRHKSQNKNVEYFKISVALWGVTAFLAYSLFVKELSILQLDYLIKFDWQNIVAFTFISIALVYLMLLVKSIVANEQLRFQIASKFEPYIDLMPINKSQLIVFTLLLSVTAGICEEIIFRAYLYNFTKLHVGNIGAIIFSSLIFGFWHINLGWQEVMRTAFMGALLCCAYIFTGNIIFPIILHIFIDVYSGVICYFATRNQNYCKN